MPNLNGDYAGVSIVDLVEDTVSTWANSIPLLARKLLTTRRPRLFGE
jgi:hypothetical protein